MRVVIYANDFEPITVIELSNFAYDHMVKYGFVRLAVMKPVSFVRPTDNLVMDDQCWVVELIAERLIRGRHETLMIFTSDEEAALMLKSAFLPGQRASLQDRERDAFVKGFFKAINMAGKPK